MRAVLILLLAFWAVPAAAGVAERAVLRHDGVERIYYLFVPPGATEPVPLVVALHGMGGNARNLRYGIGLTKRAAEQGFAVAYPQGVRLDQGSRAWNAGFAFMETDDVGFIAALVEHLAATEPIDRGGVSVLGISMGAYMAYHLACRAPFRIRAIAAAIGTMSGPDWRDCPAAAGRPSLFHIHGRGDPVIRADGSTAFAGAWSGAPALETIAATWAERLGAVPAAPLGRSARVTEHRFLNAASGAEVQLLVIEGFGHDWPSPETAGLSAIDGIVGFFRRAQGRRFAAAEGGGR